MQEWNAVISVNEHGFKKAFDVFGDFGEVRKTEFFNVLLMHADDITVMLETLRERWERAAESLDFLARIIPVTHTFTFNSAEEFERKAKEIVLPWAPRLSGMGFHVRLHRRGFKNRLRSPDEERLLDELLLDALEKSALQGHIEFEHPDAVIAIETVGTWAGLFFWTSAACGQYPFVRVS